VPTPWTKHLLVSDYPFPVLGKNLELEMALVGRALAVEIAMLILRERDRYPDGRAAEPPHLAN